MNKDRISSQDDKRGEDEKLSFREAAPSQTPVTSLENKEPVSKTETSEGDGVGEVTGPAEVPLAERIGKLESMLALVLEEKHEKQVNTSGEIPDHRGEREQSYKAESQGKSTTDGTLTNGTELLGINVTP